MRVACCLNQPSSVCHHHATSHKKARCRTQNRYKALICLGKGQNDPILAMTVGRVVEASLREKQKHAQAFGYASSSSSSLSGAARPRLGPHTRRFANAYLLPHFRRHSDTMLAGTVMWWTNALPVHARLGGFERVAPAGPREHFICEARTGSNNSNNNGSSHASTVKRQNIGGNGGGGGKRSSLPASVVPVTPATYVDAIVDNLSLIHI